MARGAKVVSHGVRQMDLGALGAFGSLVNLSLPIEKTPVSDFKIRAPLAAAGQVGAGVSLPTSAT
jgi:hypothetical protein